MSSVEDETSVKLVFIMLVRSVQVSIPGYVVSIPGYFEGGSSFVNQIWGESMSGVLQRLRGMILLGARGNVSMYRGAKPPHTWKRFNI